MSAQNGLTTDVEPKYPEPMSVADARERLHGLRQRDAALSSDIAAINAEKPGRGASSEERKAWGARRGRYVESRRRVVAQLQFVKNWLHNAEQAVWSEDDRPSHKLHAVVYQISRLEDLFLAVGDFLLTDSDESYEAMRVAHRKVAGEDALGGDPA
jgi:hypothetical protein